MCLAHGAAFPAASPASRYPAPVASSAPRTRAFSQPAGWFGAGRPKCLRCLKAASTPGLPKSLLKFSAGRLKT